MTYVTTRCAVIVLLFGAVLCGAGAATAQIQPPSHPSHTLRTPNLPPKPAYTPPKAPATPVPASPATPMPQLSVGAVAGDGSTDLNILAGETLEFHGDYGGVYPARAVETPWTPDPPVHWTGNVVRVAGFTLTGTDDPREPVADPDPYSHFTPDFIFDFSGSGVWLDVPIHFAKIPAYLHAVRMTCVFSDVPAFAPVGVAAGFGEQHAVGFAGVVISQRDPVEEDWALDEVLHLPVSVKPYMTQADLKAVQCSMSGLVSQRPLAGWVSLIQLSDPADASFVPGLAPSGPSELFIRANVEPTP